MDSCRFFEFGGTRVNYIIPDGFRDPSVVANPIMAAKKVFDLMEAEDWNEVTELLANTAWTSQDLEEKHGVRSIELFLRLIIQLI